MDGASVFLLLVIAIVLYHVIRLKKAKDSLGWPSTEGQIVRAGTTMVPEGGSDSYGRMVEVPDIRFRYSVDGVEYSGGELSYGAGSGSTDSVVARYQPESTVTVYYNPLKPSESVLIPGAGTGNYLIIAWILFLALLVFLTSR